MTILHNQKNIVIEHIRMSHFDIVKIVFAYNCKTVITDFNYVCNISNITIDYSIFQ